jgi:hypothetical protein
VSGQPGAASLRYDEAAWLLDRLVSNDEFMDFLTEPAYGMIPDRTYEEQQVSVAVP